MTEPVSDADLEVCAAEPIHVPGTIQPHGVLLGLDPATLAVVRTSANTEALLGRPAEAVLGAHLAELLEAVPLADVAAPDLTLVNPLALHLADGRPVEGVLSRSGGLLVLELEPVAPDDEGFDTSYLRIRSLLQRLQGAGDLEELVAATAGEVRRLTGFDRVMVYRFDPEWNGEVVAEDRREDLEPFLGLWYPASDIPPQARDLYAATWLRLIASVDYVPAPILPSATGLDGAPLDLGDTVLRSVSPVHLEYLRNMGVAASMSISIKHGGRLWGLVACHHQDRAHRPPYRVRAVAELVGQLVSTLLPGVEETGSHERSMATGVARGRIADALATGGTDPLKVLEGIADDVLALAGADGAAVRAGGRTLLLGRTPGPDEVAAVVRAARAGATDEVVAVDSLGDEALKDVASGVAVAPVGAGGEQWVAWFRPELLRDVSWGGDPRQKVVKEGERISPRLSFARWTETVRLRSRPWEARELEGAAWFGRHLADVLLRESVARAEVIDTVQRTLLLEALPKVPGVELAARYVPGEGDAVGGDWYDVFWLPGGRIAVAVGDVAGHGLGSAPAMAQLRHGLRAYLLKEDDPGAALDRLDELVRHLLPDDLASLVVADLDPATGRMRVANAGHLPPVLVRGGVGELLATARGPALGVVPGFGYGHADLQLDPGDALLLFTDGLVERRREGIDVSLERLRSAASALPPDLEDACDAVLSMAPGSDDVTLLALRRA